MYNYIDKWGRYHDKPCINGEPSSNNGWIYTAYAKKLGLELDYNKLWDCWQQCSLDSHRPIFNRSPGKELPPASRDEVLGLVELGFLEYAEDGSWNFSPRPIPRFNPIKLVKQLWELRPEIYRYGLKGNKKLNIEWKHRNYFWENNLDQLYRFAFSVPVVDRPYGMRKAGATKSLKYVFYRIIEGFDRLSTKKSGIRWLKYDHDIEGMLQEFPEDHPFRKKKIHYKQFFMELK